VRGTFNGGVSSVPSLICDGGGFKNHPGYYTLILFNQLANVPAIATTTGTATVDTNSKKVDLHVTINPVTNFNNPNLRFFAAIIEKGTFKNVKTNGETEFHYVMKKFMTNINGDIIAPLELNTPITRNYSYTFRGNYRLPTSASSPINHSTEHSVEDFNSLMVVYWLQDIVTKEVYQAGKADPYPGYNVSIADIAFNSSKAVIYPNPAKDNLTILAADPVKEVSIHNLLGQKISSYNGDITTISVSDLAKGIYIITVRTENGITNQKFIKE